MLLTSVLNSLMSQQKSVRTLMVSALCDVQAAFLRLPRETARELNRVSARLRYLVFIVGNGGCCGCLRSGIFSLVPALRGERR